MKFKSNITENQRDIVGNTEFLLIKLGLWLSIFVGTFALMIETFASNDQNFISRLDAIAVSNPQLGLALIAQYLALPITIVLALAIACLIYGILFTMIELAVDGVDRLGGKAYGYYLNRKAKINTPEVDKGNKVF